MDTVHNKYPAIACGYCVFITPEGGHISLYEENNGLKRALSPCDDLNVQACAILQQCTGCNTVVEICEILEKTFEDVPPDLFDQVKTFLDKAFQKGYITYGDTPVEGEGLIKGSLDYYVPSQVLLETTTGCNLECGHCYLSAGEPLPDELPVSEFIPILEKLYTMGVKRVHLSGGEILTKKGWDILADFCKNRFSSSILSNGILITDDIADRLSEYSNIHISLYGKDAETHEKISNVKGSFERAVTGITLLAERGAAVSASVIVVPYNIHQVKDIVALAVSLKCTAVQFGAVCPVGRARDRFWELTEEQMDWLRTEINALSKKYKEIDIRWEEELQSQIDHRCRAGSALWVITANGDVYPCEVLRIPVGNVTKDDLEDLCRFPAMKFLQEVQTPHDAMCGDCLLLHACEGCHGHAFALHSGVDHCKWAEQFDEAPEPFKSIIKHKKEI